MEAGTGERTEFQLETRTADFCLPWSRQMSEEHWLQNQTALG